MRKAGKQEEPSVAAGPVSGEQPKTTGSIGRRAFDVVEIALPQHRNMVALLQPYKSEKR